MVCLVDELKLTVDFVGKLSQLLAVWKDTNKAAIWSKSEYVYHESITLVVWLWYGNVLLMLTVY